MPRLTKNEKKWLADQHPQMAVVERAKLTVIQGKLTFQREFNTKTIADSYHLLIKIPTGEKLPEVLEIKGRLLKVLAAHPNFKLSDLHMYPNEKLCVAAPQELRLKYLPEPNLRIFFKKYLEPYLYSQSFFEKHDEWPWPHLPHNTTGMLEWYSENSQIPGAARETAIEIIKLSKQGHGAAKNILTRAYRRESFNPRGRCLCGSGRIYIKCHLSYARLALELRFAAT